jgi:AcrR family transcriptional regulator
MPKQLFFEIKEEKRKRFLDAAIFEFTSKPFPEVSVNTIIKKAGISRGSFYTYFDDLEELFHYIFQGVKHERLNHAKLIMQKVDHDFFKFANQLFEYDYDAFSVTGRYSLFRNYIYYIQTMKKVSFQEYIISSSLDEFTNGKDISEMFNYKEWGIDFNQFLDIIELTILIMVHTFIKAENEKLSKVQVLELFRRRMSLIANGVTRQ